MYTVYSSDLFVCSNLFVCSSKMSEVVQKDINYYERAKQIINFSLYICGRQFFL